LRLWRVCTDDAGHEGVNKWHGGPAYLLPKLRVVSLSAEAVRVEIDGGGRARVRRAAVES
jgi:hypothetical protein